jgi:hypothetical protein
MCFVGTLHSVINYTPQREDKKVNEVQIQSLLIPSLDVVGSKLHLFCKTTSDRTQEKKQPSLNKAIR